MDLHDASVAATRRARGAGSALLTVCALVGCGGVEESGGPQPLVPMPDLYASEVVRFEPGEFAGYGQDRQPDIVLGAPQPTEDGGGSLHVLSLGLGGQIELGFGARRIVNGPGPDFVVFENVFEIKTAPGEFFTEVGEVSVSEDGVDWVTFACDAAGDGQGRFPGCAGWRPTLAFDPAEMDPLVPAAVGGDPFDLDDVGLESARFVRIRDLSTVGEGTSAGFDLDAVGLVHLD